MTRSTSDPGRRPLRVLVAAAVAMGWSAQGAGACSCLPPGPPDAEFDRAGAVLTATALDVPAAPGETSIYLYRVLHEIDDVLGTELGAREWMRPVVFEVDASWKGVETTRAVIWTGYGGGDCGVPFAEGNRYLIYARLSDGDLHTSICSRTAELHAAAEDLAALSSRSPLTLNDPKPVPRLVMALVAVAALSSLAVGLRFCGRPTSRGD